MQKTFIAAILLIIALLFSTYVLVIHQDIDINKAHGTVDIKDSLLSFERAGKIIKLNTDEGQLVRKGDILARLDSQALEHQQRINFAQCEAEQALLNQYQNGYLKEELDTALAAVEKTKAAVKFASLTFERNESLLKSKSASQQEYDSAKASFEEAKAALAEATAQYQLLKRGYREEIIYAQASKVSACKEQLRYLHYQINQQGVIVAPFTGTIRARTHETSDFVGAGETIFALTNEEDKKIRIYLNEEQLKLIKLGQKVIVVNSQNTGLNGTISFISPTAMFTPKSVQTEELRSDLVYEVSVEVKDVEHILRFGQAVTVYLNNKVDNKIKVIETKQNQANTKVQTAPAPNQEKDKTQSALEPPKIAIDPVPDIKTEASKAKLISFNALLYEPFSNL